VPRAAAVDSDDLNNEVGLRALFGRALGEATEMKVRKRA
jgi:hypothetical protein